LNFADFRPINEGSELFRTSTMVIFAQAYQLAGKGLVKFGALARRRLMKEGGGRETRNAFEVGAEV
jgi:hypothetical protein